MGSAQFRKIGGECVGVRAFPSSRCICSSLGFSLENPPGSQGSENSLKFLRLVPSQQQEGTGMCPGFLEQWAGYWRPFEQPQNLQEHAVAAHAAGCWLSPSGSFMQSAYIRGETGSL